MLTHQDIGPTMGVTDGANNFNSIKLFTRWLKWTCRFIFKLETSKSKKSKRQTYEELNNLTDYELRDLGIGRSDIPSIAAGTFDDVRVTKSKYATNENLKG